MKLINSYWQKLRQIDEQAGAFNPYYDFANKSFDMLAHRHRSDLMAAVRRLKGVMKRKG